MPFRVRSSVTLDQARDQAFPGYFYCFVLYSLLSHLESLLGAPALWKYVGNAKLSLLTLGRQSPSPAGAKQTQQQQQAILDGILFEKK